MSENPFKLDSSRRVVIPTGGDFQPTGFIGPWIGAVMMCILTRFDISEMKERDVTTYDMMRQAGSEWYRYYWHDYDAATEASETLKEEYPPRKVWVFDVETKNILNFAKEETAAKFRDRLTFDHCSIASLRSRNYRHELHMIALPAFVRAYAAMMWNDIDVPDFDEILELTNQNTLITDTYQDEMIGDSPDEYEKSRLWQYRVRLWNALGEENARAYKPIGSGTAYDVTSEKLNEALLPLHEPWTEPVYLRLVPVRDPGPKGINKNNDKRLRIPTVMEIFTSKEQAGIAATADREQMSGGESTATASSSTPPYPANWAISDATKGDWRAMVKQLKDEGPTPVVLARLRKKEEAGELEDEIAATVADVEVWLDHV